MVYDINFGCDGTIVGLITIGNILQNIKGKGLLLVGESNAIAGKDINRNALLEGDAAAAIALQYSEEQKEIKYAQFSDGSRANLLYKPFGKPGVMDGNAVLLFGISDVAESVKTFVQEKLTSVDDVDYFVFHQAQKLIVDGIVQEAGIPAEKVLYSCENYGNTSSASVPLTLCSELGESQDDEKIKVLLCGYGIGLSWGILYTEIEKKCILPVIETDYVYNDRDQYNKGDSVMTREEKLEVIADILEVEEVEEDNVLEDFETWDSIAVLSVISVITEETGLFPHANEIKKFKTVSDIMKAIGD